MIDPGSRLDRGLIDLGLDLSVDQRAKLLDYVGLLAKWNKAYNLTAVRDPAEMVTRHLLDSLTLLEHLPSGAVLDVGTGPGLPGIPLAVARPEQSFTLLDSNGKKTRFIVQAVAALGIANVTVVNSRLERYRPERPFEVVVARAFASIGDLLHGVGHLLAPGAIVLAMKGARPVDELKALPPGFALLDVVPLAVPGLEGERHLVRIAAQKE